MAHLEWFRANTVDAASIYFAISRARTSAAVYTDKRAKLTESLGLRDGAQVRALEAQNSRNTLQRHRVFNLPMEFVQHLLNLIRIRQTRSPPFGCHTR
jgi:hypothetical protein